VQAVALVSVHTILSWCKCREYSHYRVTYWSRREYSHCHVSYWSPCANAVRSLFGSRCDQICSDHHEQSADRNTQPVARNQIHLKPRQEWTPNPSSQLRRMARLNKYKQKTKQYTRYHKKWAFVIGPKGFWVMGFVNPLLNSVIPNLRYELSCLLIFVDTWAKNKKLCCKPLLTFDIIRYSTKCFLTPPLNSALLQPNSAFFGLWRLICYLNFVVQY
jgi:hypothetical protein